mmetsp:Transcript_25848/g.56675  ORF Transcript_25848/g.56675 Transcript_25848/m.56675 type:complete len:277 (-) Transcript_25848:58-888(-)
MNNEVEGESAKEDRKEPCNRRQVSFKLDLKGGNGDLNEGMDDESKVYAFSNGGFVRNGDKQQALKYYTTKRGDSEPCGFESRKSTEMLGDDFRACDGFSSELSVEHSPPLIAPRFHKSTLSKALKRSEETGGYIEKEKKRILHHLEHEQRQHFANLARSPNSSSSSSLSNKKDGDENMDEESSVLYHRRRRLMCEQSAKAMMTQRLPLAMMPFVERALNAVHFIQRRRTENGSGRIIHQILIDQHKQILKLREDNKNRGGNNPSSVQKTSESESKT